MHCAECWKRSNCHKASVITELALKFLLKDDLFSMNGFLDENGLSVGIGKHCDNCQNAMFVTDPLVTIYTGACP